MKNCNAFLAVAYDKGVMLSEQCKEKAVRMTFKEFLQNYFPLEVLTLPGKLPLLLSLPAFPNDLN